MKKISLPFDREDYLFFLGILLILISLISLGEILTPMGQKIVGEIFDCLKLLGGIWCCYLLLRKWNSLPRIERISYLTFCSILPILCAYNFYCVIFLHETINYMFNMCYHLIVLNLYMGLLWRIITETEKRN